MSYQSDDVKTKIGVFVIFIIFVLLVVDIAFGTPSLIASRVMDKRYVPQHTRTVYTTDSRGHSSSRTVVDPEQYILIVEVRGLGREYSTSNFWYNQFSLQEPVFVQITSGYFTGWLYVTDVRKWKNPE